MTRAERNRRNERRVRERERERDMKSSTRNGKSRRPDFGLRNRTDQTRGGECGRMHRDGDAIGGVAWPPDLTPWSVIYEQLGIGLCARYSRASSISASTYLEAIRSRRVGIINLVSISWPGRPGPYTITSTTTITYQPNLLSYVCHVPSSASLANIAIVSVCWTVGWCAGVLEGNSIENDSILGNNGADPRVYRRVCAISSSPSRSAESTSAKCTDALWRPNKARTSFCAPFLASSSPDIIRPPVDNRLFLSRLLSPTFSQLGSVNPSS